MRFHRYIVGFGSKERYENDISILGTLIGFFGIFYMAIDSSMASNGQIAIRSSIVLVGLSFICYLIASFHKSLIYLFTLVALTGTFYFFNSGMAKETSCLVLENKYWMERCISSARSMKIASCYLLSRSIVSAILSYLRIKSSYNKQNNDDSL